MNIKRLVSTVLFTLAVALCAFGQTPAVDVSTLPGAQFYAYYSVFANIASNEFVSEQANVATQNTAGENAAAFACTQWLSNAAVAQAAGKAIPAKPVPGFSTVVVEQNVMQPQKGTWIAQVQGAQFAACADLPPVVPVAPILCGLTPCSSAPAQPTQDQKLNSIASTVSDNGAKLDAIIAALKKMGAM
jgi:hypothetical protein